MEDYISLLKDIGVARKCKIHRLSSRPEGELVEFVVEECILASTIHKPLKIHGYTGHACPLAVIGMVALAQENDGNQVRTFSTMLGFQVN